MTSTDVSYAFLGVDDSSGSLIVTRGLLAGEDLAGGLWTDAASGRKVFPHAPSVKMLSRFSVKKLVAEAKTWGLETKGKKKVKLNCKSPPHALPPPSASTNPTLDPSCLFRMEQCPRTESCRYLSSVWLRPSMPRECTFEPWLHKRPVPRTVPATRRPSRCTVPADSQATGI